MRRLISRSCLKPRKQCRCSSIDNFKEPFHRAVKNCRGYWGDEMYQSQRFILAFSTISGALLLAFQNCSPVSFSQVPEETLALSSHLENACQNNPASPGCSSSFPGTPTCSFNGQSLENGKSIKAYLLSVATAPDTCQSETRVCNMGILSGSFQFAACAEEPAAPSACLFNGQTIGHGQSVAAYQNSSVPFGETCVQQTRTCNNGNLSGSYSYST